MRLIRQVRAYRDICERQTPTTARVDHTRKFALLVLVAGVLASVVGSAQAGEHEDYFENNVRPLLVKRCQECHGAKKAESEIRMDIKSAVMVGGAAGPLVEPGKVDSSRLWQVIQYSDQDIQMPPAGKMPPEELAILKHWIEQGAAWPDDGKTASPAKSKGGQPRNADGTYNFPEAVKRHWAYRPIQQVPVPEPLRPAGCRTPIDRFLTVKLEDKRLTFSPMASREVLIRRIAMDLHGVPPTFADVQAFVNDRRPDAIERLVDQYLASPLYGERWGRHWLDIARYADTKGYVFTDNRYFPYSYTYRDYVIKSFNEDVPYNQFVLEQLAADRLGFPENDPRLAALGFLTVGNRFLNREPDIIDDRIDVVTRGLMGMTVGCARCHDHKYDPIPTADYYSLYGVFNSSFEPEAGPIVGTVDESNPKYQAYKAELDKRTQVLEKYCDEQHADLLGQLTNRTTDCLLAAARLMDLISKDATMPWVDKEPRTKLAEQWKKYITQRIGAKDPIWLAWKSLMDVPDAELAANSEAKLKPVLDNAAVPAPLKEALKANPPKSHIDVAVVFGKCLAGIADEWKKAREQAPPLESLADKEHETLRRTLYGEGSVSIVTGGVNSSLFERDQNDKIRELRAKINDWTASSPDAPPRAMVMFDKDKPVKPVVFLRGDPGRRGPTVERHSPRILEPEAEKPYTQGSGRLELAQSIVSENNPLTARVIVNRVWTRHFGAGIVSTASDFGTRASEPTHPELLDYLAWSFMHEDNWSLKSLHRRIMLSQAYLQASVDRPDAYKIDPENQLLWRQNRQRLDFEAMRDAMLAVSGQLDEEIGGHPLKLESEDIARRRTVYALIDRNNLPGLFRTFDFPSPDASSPGRPLTTVPQQALFVMNSPFVQSVSQKLAQRVRSQSSDPAGQAKVLLQDVFGRPAQPAEVTLLANYLEKHPLDQLSQALLMTNEFMFVD
ncbi:PSD1 and planctomycete cytochrome C domain-containing protein [Planctomicrobium piriforme]|uniref:Planctomycete cytochrome C n=1 Tax=Planctomicrobium piriforme TaxID=1576369 RepID=A0A1I3L596_9PLAN|nr:PSD1 and planctomycete cytochrome C domain-containing protein [Planctomicrobium piriforme]SFI79861.1 Planctomycete cytochrome C [Planctomicrobium piriforme]